MSKKVLILSFILLAVVAMIAAPIHVAVAQDPTPTEEPLPSTEGVLTVWVNLERAPIIEAAGKAFEEKYGIPVRVQTMGFGDVRNNFNIAAPAGKGPDIIAGAHDWVGQLYGNGLLAPIELTPEVAEKFDAGALELFNYDGKLVGLPYQVEAIAMYYNKDLVTEVPETLDEAVALSEALVKDGKVEQGIAFPTDPYHTFPLFSMYGGGVFGRDAEGNYDPTNVLLDSEGTIAGAMKIDELVKAGVLRDGVDYGKQSDLFKAGKLAMWVTGPWELNNLRTAGVNFGVAKIPAGTQAAAPFIGGQGFMVNAFSKNLLLAQAFLTEFVASDEVQDALFDAAPGISAWLATRESKKDDDLSMFALSVADGQPMPTIPQMAAFWSTAGNAVTLIYQQKGDPAEIMKEAATAAREEIAKSK